MGSRDRREELIAEITARLRRVCQHMSDGDFAALVRDIARVTQKYEERAAPTWHDAPRDRESGRDR